MKAPWKSKMAVPIMIVMLIAIISLCMLIGVMILNDFKIPDNYTHSQLELLVSDLKRKPQDETPEQTELLTETVTETETDTETEADTEFETEIESESETDTEASNDDLVIVIDAGHQGPGQDMSLTEQNGPGSDVMKAKFAVGTSGAVTGQNEYELTLNISLLLQTELESRGYRVVMTRTTHDKAIGNIDRAQIANDANADAFVRIHANGDDDSSIKGALTMSPSSSNPYVGRLYDKCIDLSNCIINAYCSATGLKNNEILPADDMTGINWSKVPVTILEMGYMTNSEDDLYMADSANHAAMVKGIADGIDDYFNR